MTKVVDMRGVRDLLAEVEELRQRVLRGKIKAWAVAVRDEHGREAIYLGGSYKRDSAAALEVGMRMSWAQTQIEEEEDDEQVPRVKLVVQ